MRGCLFSLCALGMALGVRGATFDIVVDREPKAVMQLVPEPSAAELAAAKDFQRFVGRRCGKTFSWYANPNYAVCLEKNLLEIDIMTIDGAHRFAPEDIRARFAKSKYEDAFAFVTTERPRRRLMILGKTPIGVLRGTSFFLEKYAGVKFLRPGRDGTCIVRDPSLRVGDLSEFHEPAVRRIELNLHLGSIGRGRTREEIREWLSRRGYTWSGWKFSVCGENAGFDRFGPESLGGGLIQTGGHEGLEIAVPDSLFEKHPEYFPLKADGTRAHGRNTKRCFSHPDVRRLVAEYIANYCDYPKSSYVFNFADVGGGWCACSSCSNLAMNAEGKFSVPLLVHRFTAAVTKDILKRSPEADVSFLAYLDYREPPPKGIVAFDPRLLCVYCPHQRCYVHPLGDDRFACNRKFRQMYEDWRTLGTRMGLFEYYCYASAPYCPLEYVLAEDMRYYAKTGLDTWIDDTSVGGDLQPIDTNWQMYYVASRLRLEPNLDVDRLMDETYRAYYGPAADEMIAYHRLRRELWERAPGCARMSPYERYGYCLREPGAEEKLRNLLTRADANAAGDNGLYKRHIAFDRECLEKLWMPAAEKKAKLHSGQPPLPALPPQDRTSDLITYDSFEFSPKHLDGGHVFGHYLQLPLSDVPLRLKGSLKAKGKGKFVVELIRERVRTPLVETDLTAEEKTYTFTGTVEPTGTTGFWCRVFSAEGGDMRDLTLVWE